MDLRVAAIIPARYESTRLPGKPLAMIDGKPMIQHVYERTTAAAVAGRVLVATDDARIHDAVRAFGGEVVWTKADHRSGTDRVAEVAESLDNDVIVNVQGDVPFIHAEMLSACVAPLADDPTLLMGTVCTPITDGASFANPNVVKVVTDRNGDALYFSRCAIPCHRDGAGGDAPLGFRHIGLYAYRRGFLLAFARLAPTPLERAENLEQLRALESGFRIRVSAVATTSIEVDTAEDLERARAFARRTTGEEASHGPER